MAESITAADTTKKIILRLYTRDVLYSPRILITE